VFLLGKKMPATRDTWPILTVADLGFFQIFSREKESAGLSDSYIYILYIYIIYTYYIYDWEIARSASKMFKALKESVRVNVYGA